jgi:RNA polymerase sigma-70 factor (ECF subfamily)
MIAKDRPQNGRLAGDLGHRRPFEPLATRTTGEAELVARFNAGDDGAFEAIYVRHFDRVYGFLLHGLRDPHEAEDAAQRVFINATRALPRFEHRPDASLLAWLLQIARNELYSIIRTRLRPSFRLESLDWVGEDELPSRHDSSARDWITDEDLAGEFDALPAVQRQILILSFGLELSSPEIGQIVGKTPAAVRQQQSRALRGLAQAIRAKHPVREARACERHPMRLRFAPSRVLTARRFAY